MNALILMTAMMGADPTPPDTNAQAALALAAAARNRSPVKPKSVECLNCSSCGTLCQCAGGGSNCLPGKCSPLNPIRPAAEPVLPTDPSQPAPPGFQWIKRGDGPWKCEKITEKKAAVPEVTGLGTFRNGGYNASHRCPTCGFQSPPGQGTWIVRGQNPDGTHTHVCPLDGTTWRH